MISPELLLILPSLLALITLSNLFSLNHLKGEGSIFSGAITVLVPLRDEEMNVSDLVNSLKGQQGLSSLRVILIDDNSTDKTHQIAQETIADDPGFLLLTGGPLPEGWLGKPFAMHQGFLTSHSDLLVLIDADVRLKPYAIAEAAALLERKNLDYLSAYPKEIALSWSERLIQPLLQWSWMATVPLKIAERSSNPALAVANGQFFVLRRTSLREISGFESIRDKVIDDIELARILIRNGFCGMVVDGSQVATCRMYKSWNELRDGYGKSLPVAFGGFFGMCAVSIFLFITSLLPLLLALTGSLPGLLACLLIYLSRFLSARATGGRTLDVIAHPFSALLLIFLIIRSWRLRGTLLWKGRPV